MSNGVFKIAPNNPSHLFVANTLYMLTVSICEKEPLIKSPQRKADWRNAFYEAARIYQWQIAAWAVLDNHYHAVVQSPENPATLSKFIGSYHKFTAHKWNREDNASGRRVWWNYWDTCNRSERDYYNRLRYVFWNPAKHGLAEDPEEYAFSNYKQYLMQAQDLDLTGMDEINDVPEF